MQRFRQYSVFTVISIAVVSLTTSCGPSKISQCNQLIEVINKGEPLANEFQQEATKSNAIFQGGGKISEVKSEAAEVATTFEEFSNKWGAYNQEVEGVEIVDETLIGLQGRYVENGDKFSESIRSMSQSMTQISEIEENQEGLQSLEQISSAIQTDSQELTDVGQENSEVVGEINSYCGAT